MPSKAVRLNKRVTVAARVNPNLSLEHYRIKKSEEEKEPGKTTADCKRQKQTDKHKPKS